MQHGHPPVVTGQPKLRFTMRTPSGSDQYRYATLDLGASDISQGYLQYNYAIQGTDSGTILSQMNVVASDEHNITIFLFCARYDPFTFGIGNRTTSYYDTYLEQGLVTGFGAVQDPSPVMTNVRINADSSPVTENQVRILVKRSAVAGKVPLASDLLLGELAANTTDGVVFMKRGDDSIAQIKPIEPQDFDTLTVNISGDTNNLSLGLRALARLSSSSDGFKISGFSAGRDGEVKMIYNGGSNTIKILNDSSSSDSGNRVAVYNGMDFDLQAGNGATIVYDGTSGVWRLF